ncbi:hypothetical protein [Sinorhizobium meliloti]|uniref:hypothetical protein n=1 Tax=Rhizobium meliloti TaxID=382 RepID=UPI003B51A6A5
MTILKFGGSNFLDLEGYDRVALHIEQRLAAGENKIVVVVSAMKGAKLEEAPGVPSQLDIQEVELPETRNSDGPMNWSHRDLKLTSAQADFLTRGLNSKVHQRVTERTELILGQRRMYQWRRDGSGYLEPTEKGKAALSHYKELQANKGG